MARKAKKETAAIANIARNFTKYQWDIAGLSVQVDVPVILWGDPGTAKTSLIYQLAKNLDMPCEVLIGSIHEPSDLAGLPVIVDKYGEAGVITGQEVIQSPPRWAREASKRPTLLFFDELTTCAPSVQAAILRIAFDRVVGELKLHPGTRIVAAANPPDQAANGYDLAAPLANRFIHIEDMEPDVDRWVKWMWATDEERETAKVSKLKVDQEKYKETLKDAKRIFGSYIMARPDKLHNFPGNDSQRGKTWASQRSWDMASKLYAAVKASNTGLANVNENDLAMYAVSCAVGMDNAHEFSTWQSELDLPDPVEVLKNYKLLPLDRGDIIYASFAGIISHVKDQIKKGNKDAWTKGWGLVYHIFNNGMKDIALTFFQNFMAIKPHSVIPDREITKNIMEFYGEAKVPVRNDSR